MTSFLIVAALMTAMAAAAVAYPLLRDRRSRLVALTATVVLVVGAGTLYKLWSTWNWSATGAPGAAPVSPQVAAMVAKLEQHLKDHPDDLNGWLMLGRSYVAVNRLDDAIQAFDQAYTLSGGKNLAAVIGYGEALALRSGGEITPEAAQLFEDAVTMAPANPKALLYGGFAAAVRGEKDLARSRWQALIALNPPPAVVQMLNARIAQLGPATGPPAPAAAAAATSATVTIHLTIAPALKARLRANAPLFLFAQEPGVRGPPLAVKRLTVGAIGTDIELSSADSMIPGRVLSAGEHVMLTARVSFSGQPMPSAGDLYGALPYDVGKKGPVDLVIDHIAQ